MEREYLQGSQGNWLEVVSGVPIANSTTVVPIPSGRVGLKNESNAFSGSER